MRDIVFRAKSGQTWYYGGVYCEKFYHGPIGCDDYVYRWHLITEEGDEYQVSSKTICQYTGLRDTNCVRIFEGDFVRTNITIPSAGTNIFTVEFVEGNYYICHDGIVAPLRSWCNSVEVVGNVYDNKCDKGIIKKINE